MQRSPTDESPMLLGIEDGIHGRVVGSMTKQQAYALLGLGNEVLLDEGIDGNSHSTFSDGSHFTGEELMEMMELVCFCVVSYVSVNAELFRR